MTNQLYDLYRRNLPDIIRSEEKVKEILDNKQNHHIYIYKENNLAGVSIINENTIYLLCVDKPCQNQGIGTRLLSQSEEYIFSKGHEKVTLGAGKDYIIPGVPMNKKAHEFFKKRGYTHAWGETGCFDMSLNLADFNQNQNSIGDTINGITYRWATPNDIEGVTACVKSAMEEFLQYYQDTSLYEKGSNTTVLLAVQDGEIIGTLQVAQNVEGKGIGSVGCTTTNPKHRGKGIATTMIILGTKHLKDMGLPMAFLSFTFTDIVPMYGKAGYTICMEYFKGEKVAKPFLTTVIR